ncbi:MAG TPA: hypothetical protein VER96_26170 [Polyangiaceae bacterium]|nr:hypothetical protein [Polyangiaceae bacterium]
MRHPMGFLCFVGVALFGLLGCRREPPGVVCHVTYGGEVTRVAFAATANPYTVKALDVAGRFAFKVIYVREPWQAASISVYAYQRTSGGDRLLQEGKYARPFSPGGEARYGFTGRQLLYSTEQRELEYWCELPP